MLGKGNLLVAVESTFDALLAAEDTDGDGKITVDDHGPKVGVMVLCFKWSLKLVIALVVLTTSSKPKWGSGD